MSENSRFDWDDANIRHIARHGIVPDEVEQVLDMEPMYIEETTRNKEVREVLIGQTKAGRILRVVTTRREKKLRVVTAHPVSQRLREEYLLQKGFRDV